MDRTINLKSYLPPILQDIVEYNEISNSESPELTEIETHTENLILDAFISTMSEDRLVEWERALGIPPSNASIVDRRSVVLSKYRGTGKLNSELISAIVNAFTGGFATTTFDAENGVINVYLKAPNSSFVGFDKSNVEKELAKRKPAHLLLNVKLDYSTWKDISDDFLDWQHVKTEFSDWDSVKQYSK